MKIAAKVSVVMFLLFNLVACAPTLYTVNLKHDPRDVPAKDKDKTKITVAVAAFNEAKKQDVSVGRVVRKDGSEIPVVPKQYKAHEAVTKGIQDQLKAQGFNVLEAQPPWDGREETIVKTWGDLLIGGTIEELEIKSSEETMTYEAIVKLAVHFADVKKGKILHKTKVIGRAWQEYYWCVREKKLEEILNDALREVIVSTFSPKDMRQYAGAVKP